METHYHFTAVSVVYFIALMVAVFGTVHQLALTTENRASRAWISLGF